MMMVWVHVHMVEAAGGRPMDERDKEEAQGSGSLPASSNTKDKITIFSPLVHCSSLSTLASCSARVHAPSSVSQCAKICRSGTKPMRVKHARI